MTDAQVEYAIWFMILVIMPTFAIAFDRFFRWLDKRAVDTTLRDNAATSGDTDSGFGCHTFLK